MGSRGAFKEENMGSCDGLGHIREARAILMAEQLEDPSREIAIVITKLDEAELWRQRDMQIKAPPVNEVGGGS